MGGYIYQLKNKKNHKIIQDESKFFSTEEEIKTYIKTDLFDFTANEIKYTKELTLNFMLNYLNLKIIKTKTFRLRQLAYELNLTQNTDWREQSLQDYVRKFGYKIVGKEYNDREYSDIKGYLDCEVINGS